jgi:hypothetical protein
MNIKSLTLKSNDIESTVDFYRRLFNAGPQFRSGSAAGFKVGESVLIFEQSDVLKPVYHFAVDIPCNQLNEAFEFVSNCAKVLPVSDEQYFADFKNWNAQSFYFLDNNGNILEYICRYDRQIEYPGPFNGQQLISISEAGLPAEKTPQLMAKIMYNYPLTPYEKQPPLENFAALGDVNGLLILSNIGRAWYPTQVPASVFPLTVIFEMAGVDYEYKVA